MEIKEAIEILKPKLKFLETFSKFNKGDRDYFEAIQLVIALLSKIQNAEMPKKKGILSKDEFNRLGDYEYAVKTGEHIGYNQCHDDFLAYHLRKMGERVDLRRFAEENDLLRKFRYSRLEHYVDKDDTWDKKKYENDAQFHAEIDTKVAYEVAMFNPILDFISQAIAKEIKE